MEGGFPSWKALKLPVETSAVPEETVSAPSEAARKASDDGPAAYTAHLDTSKASLVKGRINRHEVEFEFEFEFELSS